MSSSPLWTEIYAPDVSDFRQERVRDQLELATNNSMNLLISGPTGVGKTSAAYAVLREIHDEPEKDIMVINVADMFGRTKKELRNDSRFSDILSGNSRMAKRDMINKVIKDLSSTSPVSGGFKTIILDNAEDARDDFQQSLRRTIEVYSESTQFVFTTRNPAGLIQPLRSRCHPIHITPPSLSEARSVLLDIAQSEDVDYDRKALNYIWSERRPNLRGAILLLQTTADRKERVSTDTVSEIENEVSDKEEFEQLLDYAEKYEFKDMRKQVKTILNDIGYDAETAINKTINVAIETRDEEDAIHLAKLSGDTGFRLTESNSDKIQLVELLSNWATTK